MKNIINKSILFLSLLLAFSACEEQLDLAPISEIGDTIFYTTTEEVEGAVIAIYDGLQEVPLREFALTEMRSDNTKTKSSEGDWAQFESFDVKPTNLSIGTYWAANYNVIFRANRVLENLSVVDDTELKSQFEGEAKFTRALSHFNLVRAFGDVPYMDRVIRRDESDFFGRDDAETVLAGIESDLTEARSLLSSNSFGRATSGAAQALLAKVKLTRGDYNGAKPLLSELILSGAYSLETEYYDVFYSEGNNEIIFAIPYLDDDANEGQDYSFEMTAGGAVSGLNYITNDFNDHFDADEVARDTTLYNPDNTAEVGKFLTVSDDARLCGNDWIVLRYADVLLMYAEAIMDGGASTNNTAAIDAYNAVRARAGMPTMANDGSEMLTKEMLMSERRTELAFENHRFYDLIRFGVAESVLGDFATNNGYSFTATDLLLPIPQGEINVSQGLLTQNPGY